MLAYDAVLILFSFIQRYLTERLSGAKPRNAARDAEADCYAGTIKLINIKGNNNINIKTVSDAII